MRAVDNVVDVVDPASRLLGAWRRHPGAQVVHIRPEQCPRPCCGGSVLVFDGERSCILCGRAATVAVVLTPGRRTPGAVLAVYGAIR